MSAKKKFIITLVTLVAVLVVVSVGLIVALVSPTQNASASITVRYEATNVAVDVSATYKIGSQSAVNMYAQDGVATVLSFNNDVATAKNQTLAPTASELALTNDDNYILFEYKFVNRSKTIDIDISLDTTQITNNNVVVRYAYANSSTAYSSLNLQSSFTTRTLVANASANATTYIYIAVRVNDQMYDATYSGTITWGLDRHTNV